MDERLEELRSIYVFGKEPALKGSRECLKHLDRALRWLWSAQYVECRSMVFDQYAVHEIIFEESLPEHFQRIADRYCFGLSYSSARFIGERLFEEIICGSAVMSVAGKYFGHAWSRDVFEKMGVRKNRETKKLFSDTQRTVHA